MKPSPGSKNPCNKGAGYQNQFLVTKILEVPFDKPTDLLHTSSISKQSTALSIPIEAPAGPDCAMKKFKPKFSPLKLKSNPPQFAKVMITNMPSTREQLTFRSKMEVSLVTKNCRRIFNMNFADQLLNQPYTANHQS